MSTTEHGHVPGDDLEREALAHIERTGCHVVMVRGEPGCPPFAYSVGIPFTAGAPELVVYGLGHELAQAIVNDYLDRVRGGDRFDELTRYGGFLEGFDVMFAPVAREHYERHLGWAEWFHRGTDFDALQLIWPSTCGAWPCDPDASLEYRTQHVTLYACDCPPERHPRPAPTLTSVHAFVCEHVFQGTRPVVRVVHDEDGDWQLLCEDGGHGEPRLVHLSHFLESDPRLREIIDLPRGQAVERDSVDGAWRASPR